MLTISLKIHAIRTYSDCKFHLTKSNISFTCTFVGMVLQQLTVRRCPLLR